tara:strand:- start:189 stop:428 length:240 start_codon:yes stop_codon:yes gene_type:complete
MNREHIIVMADASGLSLYGMGKDREEFIDYLECFAAFVASAEREACAKLVKDYMKETAIMEARGCLASVAYDIRARGEA